jgi:CHASE2 domain-containing sensor protein
MLSPNGKLTSELAGEVLRAFRAPGAPPEGSPYQGFGELVAPLHYEAALSQTNGGLAYYPSDRLPKTDIEDRLVLVASVFDKPDQSDTARTPFGSVRGGIVQLHAIDTLLRAAYPTYMSKWAAGLLCVGLFIVVLSGWTRGVIVGTCWTVFVLGGYVAIGFIAFAAFSVMVPVSWPLWSGLVAAATGLLSHGPNDEGSGPL